MQGWAKARLRRAHRLSAGLIANDERTERRRATALARVDLLLRDLRLDGFDLVVIGSLARREFRSHSDVDLLVRGRLDTPARAKVERAMAAAMRGSSISYDLIYAADLTPERLKEFERDLVQAPGVRKTRDQA